MNLVFLAFLVLIPFASDIIGLYGHLATAVIAYAIVLSATAATNWLIISYGFRQGFVAPAKRREVEPFTGVRGALVVVIFLLSIPIALLSPIAAQLTWLLIFIVRPPLPALPHGASD
jgi:uncharacterized membrane protein